MTLIVHDGIEHQIWILGHDQNPHARFVRHPPQKREIREAVYGMHDMTAHAFGATRAAFGNVASDLPQIVQCPVVKAKRQVHGRRSTASISASAANSPRSARARASVTRRSSADNG